jgi:hypothetical protein
MTTSKSIAHHIAVALAGVILASLSAAITSWLWPGSGFPVFIVFLVSWGVERINTIALERRHPELISSRRWKRVKVRYKPAHLGNDEYETTLSEFILGQIALILFGVPVALLLAGVVGQLFPTDRWLVFYVVFGVWTVLMVAGIVSAIQKR